MTGDASEWRQWIGELVPLLRILLIWVLAAVALGAIRHLLLLKLRLAVHIGQRSDVARVSTMLNVLRYTANATVLVVAVLMTLGQLGISVAPLLATASIAGIAVGFGAQSLVKDFFTGICLLVENQISEGDMIDVAGKSGVVERMTLRHVRLRDYDGAVHFIPNGIITALTNRSKEFAYAVIDVTVPRTLDLERVFGLMHAVADDMRRDPGLRGAVLEGADIAGVEKIEGNNFLLRCRLKVAPSRQWRARREFLRRLQRRLDEECKSEEAGPTAA